MTTSMTDDKDGHDAEHEHEISRGKFNVGKGIDTEKERAVSFPPTVFPQNHKQEHSHSQSPSLPVPHTTTPTYSEGEGTMTTGSTAQTVEIAELDDYDVGADLKDGGGVGGGKMARKQYGLEGGEVRIVREDEGQEEETEEENIGMGVFGALDPAQLQRHTEHRSTSYNPLDIGYGYNAHSRTISNTTVQPHPTINTHANTNPTRTETPPLTTSNLNLHQLPAHTNPEFTIKRFGLERTASWATASAGAGRTGFNSSGSADSGVASSKEDKEKDASNLVRPGYKRSRTAFPGTTSRLGALGLAHGNGKNASGLNTRPEGLQRSRSFSSSAAVHQVNGTSPTMTTAMFHPYRLALPQGKRSNTKDFGLEMDSPLFTMDNGGAGYFERPCSPISASAVAGGSKYRTRPRLTRTLSSKTDSEARSVASSTLASVPGTGKQQRSYQSSLLRPRPKLWRGFSQPGRSRLASGSMGDVPPSPGSSSLREGSAGLVDEYMIDMDKWIMGTGEASASQRSPSPSPSSERELCAEEQGIKNVVPVDRASQGEQEDLWQDGCRIQCADGTECLTTSEAYVLNVQLLHQ